MRMSVMVIVGIMTIEMMMELEGRHHVTGFAVCSNGKQQAFDVNKFRACQNCPKKKVMMTNKTFLAS